MHAVRASGYSWVYAKCTEGDYFKAATYLKKQAAAYSAGLLFGAYHFFDWTVNPSLQAEYFLSTFNVQVGDLPPMLDCEEDQNGEAGGLLPAEAVEVMSIWLHAVEDAIGRRPIVYTDPSFWTNFLGRTTGFTGHPLWIADYNPALEAPTLGIWKPMIWQYSDMGVAGGIESGVDVDWYLGTKAELEALRMSGK
jgi:lysozyme